MEETSWGCKDLRYSFPLSKDFFVEVKDCFAFDFLSFLYKEYCVWLLLSNERAVSKLWRPRIFPSSIKSRQILNLPHTCKNAM